MGRSFSCVTWKQNTSPQMSKEPACHRILTLEMFSNFDKCMQHILTRLWRLLSYNVIWVISWCFYALSLSPSLSYMYMYIYRYMLLLRYLRLGVHHSAFKIREVSLVSFERSWVLLSNMCFLVMNEVAVQLGASQF